jgi:hypothetical protein
MHGRFRDAIDQPSEREGQTKAGVMMAAPIWPIMKKKNHQL